MKANDFRSSRLTILLITALFLFAAPVGLTNDDEEIDVSITCKGGEQCTLNVEGSGGIEINFKTPAASCQAAYNDLTTRGINWPDGVTANYSLSCQATDSESAGRRSGWTNNNCCYNGWQCAADDEWTAGYYAFQNGQCAAGPQAQTQTTSSSSPTVADASSQVNNCCFVDRQCTNDHEWTAGYWAHQRGQCASSGQEQSSSGSSSTVAAASSEVNNCCFVNRQCTNDHEWIAGYWAYQNSQC
ncbi:MAG: hypothetical protein F4X02_16860 [Chloroflexi bacterium]|nr:hypothetical protein [Chloroflexota bacterium]